MNYLLYIGATIAAIIGYASNIIYVQIAVSLMLIYLTIAFIGDRIWKDPLHRL